jgi:hypothetical protein
MKTISMNTDMTTNFEKTYGFAVLGTAGVSQSRPWGPGSVPAWLPTPAPRSIPATARKAKKTTRSESSIWIRTEGDSLSEKLMMLLLVVGALVGIGYGFSYMVDLVQNWAGFNAGIGQLLK